MVPTYLSELAPTRIRGAIGICSQLAFAIALFVSQVLGVRQLLGGYHYWPGLFGLAVVPLVVQAILLFWCEESPRYLYIHCARRDAAKAVLQRLRALIDVDAELEELESERRSQTIMEESTKLRHFIGIREVRRPLLVGIAAHLSQQLCGINAIFAYSGSIFHGAGMTRDASSYATIGVCSVM